MSRVGEEVMIIIIIIIIITIVIIVIIVIIIIVAAREPCKSSDTSYSEPSDPRYPKVLGSVKLEGGNWN